MALLSLSSIIPIVSGQNEMIYKNSSYPALERATDLLHRMTWEEKIGQMGGVRTLLGASLTFNETAYNSTHVLQNGILGNDPDFLMLHFKQEQTNAKLYLSFRFRI